MTERRTFSRTARKQLNSDERGRLIADMLGEEAPVAAPNDTSPNAALAEPKTPNKPSIDDSLDALTALDAEFDEERADIRAEEAEQRRVNELHEHNVLVDDAIAQIAEELTEEAVVPTIQELPAEAEPETIVPDLGTEVVPAEHPPLELTPEYAAPDAFVENTLEAPQEPDLSVLDPILRETVAAPKEAASESAEPELAAEAKQDPEVTTKLRSAYETAEIAAVIEPADLWNKLAVMPVQTLHLEENLVITASRQEQAHGAFDVLRTRLVQTLLEHGWKRVAITSPSRNCGKTFTAVNLAISLSRYEANRTILLDMDMRNPSVAGVIGDPSPGCMGDFLRGATSAEDFLVKFDRNNLNIGPSLAIGTNGVVEPYAAELAQDPMTGKALDRMMQEMSPDIVLFDMPPALAFDDVIAFRQQFDGVLMVVGGGSTSPEEVREVMRRLGEDTPLLGVVLNQAEGEDGSDYSYGY